MRIRRRHAALLVVAAIGALAAAGAAFAITNNTSTLSVKITPNTGLSKTTYKNVSLFVHLHTNFAHPGDKAHGGFVKDVKLYFDSDGKINPGAAPVCNKNLANTTEKQAMALCGTALVGKGTAQATSTAGATIPGCVIAFNGPKNGAGQPTIILHSRFVMPPPCPNPSTSTAGSVDAILTGTVKPANKPGYGKVLDTAEHRHPAAAAEGLHHDGESWQLLRRPAARRARCTSRPCSPIPAAASRRTQ